MEGRLLLLLLAIGLLGKAFAAVASEMLEGDTLAWDGTVLLFLRDSNDLCTSVGPAMVPNRLKAITTLDYRHLPPTDR